ncbi:MAG TPA: glycosyltransferase family 25 protein [Rhabdochlamydiaceae bacterium]
MSLLNLLAAVSIFASSFSYAALQDHFKKPVKDVEEHKIRNVDFIYMINLDQRPEKFAQSVQQLAQFNIVPFRFSAVNGWELSALAINDVGLKYRKGMTPLLATTFKIEDEGRSTHEIMSVYGRAYFCHCMAPGTIGCALSHLSVLQDAWDSGYETIWVMEDDIEVLMDPAMISELIDELDAVVGKKRWDVFFTDQDIRGSQGYIPAYGSAARPDMDCSNRARFCKKFTEKKDVSRNLRKISARFGAHSMIIRRSGIKKLLEFAKAHMIFFPYDMDNYLRYDLNRYCSTFDIVTNLVGGLSDNGFPNYKKE